MTLEKYAFMQKVLIKGMSSRNEANSHFSQVLSNLIFDKAQYLEHLNRKIESLNKLIS